MLHRIQSLREVTLSTFDSLTDLDVFIIMNDYSQIVMETLTNQLYPSSVHDKCLLILLDFFPSTLPRPRTFSA